MKSAICRRRFEDCSQFHESMAGAARIETVKGDRVAAFAFKRSAVGQPHPSDSAIKADAFGLYLESEQISRFPALVNFFHDGFDLLRSKPPRDDVVFEWNKVPGVIHRLG